MTEPTLKPCPYCTSVHVKAVRMEFGKFYAVVCRDCGSTGPLVALTAYWLSFEYHDAAVKKWNDRQLTEDDVVEIRINGAEFMDNVRAAAEALSVSGDNDMGFRLDDQPEEIEDPPAESEPPAEPDTPEPPAAADDKSQTPSSGGELDTQIDAQPDRHPIADEIEAYLEASGRTIEGANLGITGSGLRNILSGSTRNPTKKTIKKIQSAIKKRSPKATAVKVKEDPEPDPGETVDPIHTFLRDQLVSWMAHKDLDVSAASSALQVSPAAINHTLAGRLPHPNVIYQIAKFIPDVNANIDQILKDRQAQDDASI